MLEVGSIPREVDFMKTLIRTTIFAAILLVCSSAFGAQISIGIQIGPPPRPRVVRVLPRQPGPMYMWVEGYWYPVGKKYKWHDGYWTLPPYGGARWIAPHHDGRMFYNGYWDGDRGRFDHDHHWDRDHDRDFRDNNGRGRGHR